jgi:hypothetical protein
MKVLKPNKNKLTQGFSTGHRAYDHSGTGDPNYYSSFHGVIVQAKNSETRQWIANTKTDPWFVEGKTRKLRTEDYGNYCKVKSEVDGKVFYQLGAHFKTGTVLPVGTEVKKGQTIAQVGSTGNSTGNHSHTEYRDENDKNIEVEFVDEEEPPKPVMEDKRQQIIDLYKGVTGEYPNEDEISLRLQKNPNRVELIEDLLRGDGRSKSRWTKEWGIDSTSSDPVVIEAYKESYEHLKHLLGLVGADNTEDVEGKVKQLVDRNKELEAAIVPKIVYRLEGRDFERGIRIGNIALIIEKLKEV